MVINSEAGRRIIVLVATSEGMVVCAALAGGPAVSCPLPVVQLLPTGAALLPVVWFEFFGLPPAQRAAWGAEAAPALSSLDYRAGRRSSDASLVICPSTCPLRA